MLEKILLSRDKTKMAVRQTVHKYVVHQCYCKIPKVSAGAYIIFSKARFDGLILEGVMYGGKFVLKNWLGYWE